MKTLITKSDGTPTKSKVHALQFLEKNGISKDCLIEENGQFFYEEKEEAKEVIKDSSTLPQNDIKADTSVSWDIPVFNKDNERTELFIPNTDVTARILSKHPAGQMRLKNSIEISINGENFVMSVELASKIFKVRG